MPAVKRRRAARPTGRRVRRRLRAVTRRGVRSIASRQVYPFKRFVAYKVTLLGNDTVPGVLGGTSFSLADVPNTNEFTALFDQYKLAGVAYRWVVNKDPMFSTTGTAVTRLYPRIVWVHDYDDANSPTLNDLYQYPNMKEFYFSDSRQTTRWYFLRPAKSLVGFEGTTNSFYAPDRKHWIDMASTGVPHFGLKYGTEGQFNGINVTLQCRYYLMMKNVR